MIGYIARNADGSPGACYRRADDGSRAEVYDWELRTWREDDRLIQLLTSGADIDRATATEINAAITARTPKEALS